MNAIVIPFPGRPGATVAAAATAHRPPATCWSAPVHDVVDQIEALFDTGDDRGVIELCRRALAHLDASSADIDDVGPLERLVVRLDTLHLRACRRARPDDVELAQWLFGVETDAELPGFGGAVERYAEVLGPAGLAEHRRLVDRRHGGARRTPTTRIEERRRRSTPAAGARARHPSAV